MDIGDEDEVYSELDFHQTDSARSNGNGRAAANNEPEEDSYIEDDFEQPFSEEAKEEGNTGRLTMPPDLGRAAKVAKKEGVIEVVERDDGKEKALSSGSQFSEISVKDEVEEEEQKQVLADAQILLDDQSETQTEHHVRGAVSCISQPGQRDASITGSMDEVDQNNQVRPQSLLQQHQAAAVSINQQVRPDDQEENKISSYQSQVLSEERSAHQSIPSGPLAEEHATHFRNITGLSAAASLPPRGSSSTVVTSTIQHEAFQKIEAESLRETDRTEQIPKEPLQHLLDGPQSQSTIGKIAQQLDSLTGLNGIGSELAATEHMTSHDPVLVMAPGVDKDMFSSDFQLASADQNPRKLAAEVLSERHERRPDDQQPLSNVQQSSEAVVAASSGAMPETFRDDSPSSTHSKPPQAYQVPAQVVPTQSQSAKGQKPQQWERRQQRGMRAPRSGQLNPLKFTAATQPIPAASTGLFRPNQTASSGRSKVNELQQNNQQSLNRQESQLTYGVQGNDTKTYPTSGLQSNNFKGNRTAKASDVRPAWGSSGVAVAPQRQRIQTSTGVPTRPQYPLKPLKTAGAASGPQSALNGQAPPLAMSRAPLPDRQARQQAAYDKFVNRGSKSVNRNTVNAARTLHNSSQSNPFGQTQQHTKPLFHPGQGGASTCSSKFMSIKKTTQANQSNTNYNSKSVRPYTSSGAKNLTGGGPGGGFMSSNALSKDTLPRNIHVATQQQRRDLKGRQMLQSAKDKSEANRLNSQKQIKVPHSQYGVKPVTSSFGRRPSATTQMFTRMNSSAESFTREKSVKNLRMSSYMKGTASQKAASQSKFNPQSSVGFRDRSASRSSQKMLAMGKSPKVTEPKSAARLASQSRASLDNTSFQGINQFPTINFKGDEDFAIKILDNMIQVEEDMQKGFSMYNRGKNLKKSLINPERVKEYLHKVEKQKECQSFAEEQRKRELSDQLISLEDQSQGSGGHQDVLQSRMLAMPRVPEPIDVQGDPDLVFLQDNHIDDDKQWRLMLDYFKKNPTALMDAIPTPPNQEDDDAALKDFRTGLTPKRGQAFKFGGDRIVNRPNYERDMGSVNRRALGLNAADLRSTSQLSARSSASRTRMYQESPRVGSARSNTSRMSSNSKQMNRSMTNKFAANQYSAQSAAASRLNRSYSSNVRSNSRAAGGSAVRPSRQNTAQHSASNFYRNSAYETHQGRGMAGKKAALNQSASSLGSGLSAQKRGLAYQDRQQSASRRAGESSQSRLALNSQRSHQQDRQKDFRISKRSARTTVTASQGQSTAKNRFQQKQLDEQKQHDSKKQHTDRVKHLLRGGKSKQGSAPDSTATPGTEAASAPHHPATQVKNSTKPSILTSHSNLPKNAITQSKSSRQAAIRGATSLERVPTTDRLKLEYIDWKESYFYKQLAVRHADDAHKWESADLLHDEEGEFLLKLIRNYRMKRPNFKVEELLKMVPPMVRKCYNSIEMVYKEVLSDTYWRQEYDQMRANDPHICKVVPRGLTSQSLKIITLENLIHRVNALKLFRKEIKSFMEMIHQRELLLKQMHMSVESIQSDAFFMSQEDLEVKKAFSQEQDAAALQAEIQAQANPRQEMLEMGNNLVEMTDSIIRQSGKFFKSFNKQFSYVRIEQLIFQEADYLTVAAKEVQEITKIFEAYEIKINRQKTASLIRSENQQLQDIKNRLKLKTHASGSLNVETRPQSGVKDQSDPVPSKQQPTGHIKVQDSLAQR